MMGRRGVSFVLAVAALLSFLWSGLLEARTRETAKAPAGQAEITPPAAEAGVPPRPPKERMGVAVLLAWVWLAVGVLFWLLRLRVREADRVFHMGLRGGSGKNPEDGGH